MDTKLMAYYEAGQRTRDAEIARLRELLRCGWSDDDGSGSCTELATHGGTASRWNDHASVSPLCVLLCAEHARGFGYGLWNIHPLQTSEQKGQV